MFLALVAFSVTLPMAPVKAAAPFVETLPATNITSTSAVLWMRVNPNGLSTSWKIFFARAGVPFTDSTFACANTATGSVTLTRSCSLSGLTPSATYHFQAAESNADGVNYGAELTFTTLGTAPATGPPIVVTLEPGVGSNQAVFFGTINPNGLETEWQFWYGLAAMAPAMTMPSPGSPCEGTLPATILVRSVSCTVTGLPPSTAYHVQLLAHNSATPPDATGYAWVRGAVIPFTTHAATAATTTSAPGTVPSVTTLSPLILSPTSVRLQGTVNPKGASGLWIFDLCSGILSADGVCPSTATSPPGCHNSLPAGTVDVPVDCTVTGLTLGASYTYHIRATDDATYTVLGDPVVFTMPSVITSSSVPHSDWAVLIVGLDQSSPQVGQSVFFTMSMTLVSTIDPLPQTVEVQCQIDGAPCGTGTVTYPGPVEQALSGTTNSPWIATAGSHTLMWSISTVNDPNPANNMMSTTFTVPSSPAQTTINTTQTETQSTTIQETTSLQFTTAQPSIPQPTTSMFESSQTAQETVTVTSELAGDIVNMIQQNSLLFIGALALLVVIVAVALRTRRPGPYQPETSTRSTGADKFCPSCGTANPSTSQFCAKCGNRLI